MEKVLLRVASLEDAAALREIYRPYVERTVVTFEYDVPSEEEFRRRMAAILPCYPYLVAEQGGRPLGYAYAAPFKSRRAYDWAVEVSIYVERSCRRGGLGRRLYQAVEDILREQGILNVNACITYAEEEDEYLTQDSPAFHSRLGYRQVARFHQCGFKFGRWYDMIWMEKHLGPHAPDQPDPRPFAAVRPLVAAKYGIH